MGNDIIEEQILTGNAPKEKRDVKGV